MHALNNSSSSPYSGYLDPPELVKSALETRLRTCFATFTDRDTPVIAGKLQQLKKVVEGRLNRVRMTRKTRIAVSQHSVYIFSFYTLTVLSVIIARDCFQS